jgi:exonuclease 3'-5' domain-containing protein 1
MLYFLEVLMNSTGPLTISQLAGRFGSSNFTPEMRTAAGGNEAGLRQFLLKYPSLFTIRGNMVSLCDGKEDDDPIPDDASVGSASVSSGGGQDNGPPSASLTRRGLPDVSIEMEAVQFFRTQLARREERWVPVKSLAGHLSQTTPEIRAVVGPQLEFRRWLLRHVHIFDVQGDVVALCDGLPGVIPTPGSGGNGSSTPALQRRITFDIPDSEHVLPAPAAPKTPPAQRRSFPSKSANQTGSLHRSHSFSDSRNPVTAAPPPPAKRHETPVTMTANEYKAVMFVKDVLERRGAMQLPVLFTQATPSTESVRATLGTSAAELGAFLRRHPGIFEIDGESVALVKNAKLSVIITGSRPAPPPPPPPAAPPTFSGRTLTGKGKIFHVAKLWGIIDLGEHEHVFFDRSIMKRPMDDLQRYFHTGEMLCFHAIMAHKTSRARWKATHVWKENEQEPALLASAAGDDTSEGLMRSAASAPLLGQSLDIEDEINEFLPMPDRESVSSDPTAVFSDADLSGSGSVAIWNFRQDEERTGRASVTVVPENYQMSASALSDLRFAPDFGSAPFGNARLTGSDAASTVVNGQAGGKAPMAPKIKKFVSVACQTVSTNDIIATQLYQDS